MEDVKEEVPIWIPVEMIWNFEIIKQKAKARV